MKKKVMRQKAGLSLVELMVVLAIGAILSILSVGAFLSVLRSSSLTTATVEFLGSLNAARQSAVALNSQVQVRLYELPPASSSNTGTPTVFRAYQTFLVTSAGYTQLTKATFLPSPVVIYSNPAYSSLLDSTKDASLTPQSSSIFNYQLPIYQNNYQVVAFEFMPTGGLNISSTQQWYLTLISTTDALGANNLPANYATVQIDPVSGKARYFRP